MSRVLRIFSGVCFCTKGEIRLSAAFRVLIAVTLLSAIFAETYYIMQLQQQIESQSEELRNMSVQLQSLKTASKDLHEELSVMQNKAGERKDGDTAQRQH